VFRPLVGLAVLGMVAFSIVGTRDSLVLQDEVWAMADRAVASGISKHELDGGSAWTRYHVGGPGRHIEPAPGAVLGWWITADGRTSARYAVSLDPLPGYRVLRRTSVEQWLVGTRASVYLLEVVGPQ
jgi:hypothetical protein